MNRYYQLFILNLKVMEVLIYINGTPVGPIMLVVCNKIK